MNLLKNTWKNKILLLMAMPALLIFLLFSYVPMFGLVMAFKDFNYADGIWNSPWVGFQNFKFLFLVGDTAWRLTRNTVGYFLLFTIVGTVLNVGLALAINEMANKRLSKFFQSCMILPTFISYIAFSFVVYALLQSNSGIVNKIIVALGGKNTSFYMDPQYWPLILLLVNCWKNTGYSSVLYLSVLTGIDQSLYEAADIDGATTWDKVWNISIPMLIPMVIVMTLLSLGSIMHSDTGLFYQVTRNSSAIYSTTQVLDSYILNALATASDFGMTAAATFYQSVVGFIMVVGTNMIVRKVAPGNELF